LLAEIDGVNGAAGSQERCESQRESSFAASEIAPDLRPRSLDAWCPKERGCLVDGHARS